jgi:hypothetical protein
LVVLAEQGLGIEGECAEPGQAPVEPARIDALGVQLLLDPRRDADALEVGDVARARAEGEPVENMSRR